MENRVNVEIKVHDSMYNTIKELLNRELKECSELLKETENAWNESMDLKLHKAFTTDIDFEHNGATVTFDAENQSKWFYEFCDYEFECFTEWCKGEGIEFEKLRDNIGRTSSFYLGKLHNDSEHKYLTALYDEVSDIMYSNQVLEYKEENGIVMLDEEKSLKNLEDGEWNLKEMIDEMLDVTSSVMSDLKHYLDPITAVYKYISAVKETQEESFKNHVEETWLVNM